MAQLKQAEDHQIHEPSTRGICNITLIAEFPDPTSERNDRMQNEVK